MDLMSEEGETSEGETGDGEIAQRRVSSQHETNRHSAATVRKSCWHLSNDKSGT